jgi:hypothetical protein
MMGVNKGLGSEEMEVGAVKGKLKASLHEDHAT